MPVGVGSHEAPGPQVLAAEDAEDFRKRGHEPGCVGVVGDSPAAAVAVAHGIGRIGKYEIGTAWGDAPHDLHAIAQQHRIFQVFVDGLRRRYWFGLRGIHEGSPVSGSSAPFTKRSGSRDRNGGTKRSDRQVQPERTARLSDMAFLWLLRRLT